MSQKQIACFRRFVGFVDATDGVRAELEGVVHPSWEGEAPMATTSRVVSYSDDESRIETKNTVFVKVE